jgi:DNA-binding transcriptional MerR regulator
LAPCWRIDELAHRAGVTVDTIRYYAREQLLPPPERAGRHKLYGPEHLDRLTQIRDLQTQRFSLAAIRAVLDSDRPGLERLFGGDNRRQLSLAELVEESGVSAEVVDGLRQVGLLPDPAEFGADAYDDADLGVLKAVAELQAVGMPPEILVELGAIYVRHFRALQHDVHDMFAGKTRDDWDPAELVSLQRQLTANTSRMIPATDQVLNYVHQRTIQRLTLEALKTAAETHTGVGGVRVPDGEERPAR